MNTETNIINRTYVEVEIPEKLCEYVMSETEVCGRFLKKRTKGNTTHHLNKILGFLLLLKAESPGSGLIQNYTKQIPTLSHNFNISQRTFFSYLNKLEQMKLAFREGKNIHIASWHQIGDALGISTNKRTKINFDYAGKQKIHWWFAALEIKGNQERQSYMIWKKINKNSEIRNSIMSALISRGFDTTKSNNLEYFSGRLFMLYIEDFKTGTEVHDILINIRSDVNRSCKKIAESWSMSKQLVSYWKAQMCSQRITEVAKLSVTWEWEPGKKEGGKRGKNKFSGTLYDEKKRERKWFLCDQIDVLMPWKWTEYLENLKAA